MRRVPWIAGGPVALALVALAAVRAPATDAQATLSYVAVGDSVTLLGVMPPGWVSLYRGSIETDLHTTVAITNRGYAGWTSGDLRTWLPAFSDDLASADLVTFQVGLNDFANARITYISGTCGGADNEACLRAMATSFAASWDAIVAEIEADAPDATLQTMDIYYPMSAADKDAGYYDALVPYVEQINAHILASAAAEGIGAARVYEAFHGASGSEDPATKGYILADMIHPSPAGHQAIATAFAALGYSDLDTDADAVADATDNCPGVYNPGQENANAEIIRLPKPVPVFDDATNPAGDDIGDACDTDPIVGDSDGDRTNDATEVRCGSDPYDAASVPTGSDADVDLLPDACEAAYGTNPADRDSDDDGIRDGIEVRYWMTDPLNANSDGDECDDGHEMASVNGDRQVTASDMQQIAVRYGPVSQSMRSFDLAGDGYIGSNDLSFVAQRFGRC